GGGCNPYEATGSRVRCDGCEAPVLDLDQHVVVDGAVDPRPLEQVRGGVAHRASRSRVSASASPPARQSAISACSAGECETPVGLRTKSIALGTPCADSPPASWPACVAMTGQSPPSWSSAIEP